MKNNKRGISAIVATVLIILITVAAVTIIWAAIIPMIQDQIGGSTECFDATAALSVTTDYSCVTSAVAAVAASCSVATCGTGSAACTTQALCVAETAGVWTPEVLAQDGTVDVQVHRGTGNFELVGIEIITGVGGNTESKAFDSTEIPSVNGDKVYSIAYTGDAVTEAGVAAIVLAGNTQKTCDKSGMIQIPTCA